MANSGLGTWRNPPLAYVVAEVVISPHYSIQTKMPELQDALRSEYPRTLEAQELIIEGNNTPPAPQPIWRLLSADQGRGVQFGSRAISLHATLYQNSTDFLDRWVKVLQAVSNARLDAFVERAGLRFTDLIVPSEGRDPSSYLASGLQGVGLEGLPPRLAMWNVTLGAENGEVVQVRTAAPAPEGMLLPPNLHALPLQKPNVMLAAEKQIELGGSIGFIDTDCSMKVETLFDAVRLRELFQGLQKTASRAFQTVVSATARKEWV